VLEAADPPLTAGAPFDQPAEATLPLDHLAGGTDAAPSWDRDPGHAKVDQFLVDAGFAVARSAATARGALPVRAMTRPMAGANSGASGGLPTMT
jgi:hypothetical protein